MRGIFCCARSERHAATPPINEMNSRRLVASPEARTNHTNDLNQRAGRGPNVRFGSKADICTAIGHVRFTPESGHVQCTSACLLWANSGLMQRSKNDRYFITVPARGSSVSGIVKPSALVGI